MDLSIIVPVYNVEKYIRSCILSIFHQGLEDSRFEVIIVNDGTTDRSMEMIEDIITQHPNIIVINQENQGLSVARNNGIEQSSGDFICFLDSDDLLISNSITDVLKTAIEKKPDLLVASFISKKEEDISDQYNSPQGSEISFIEKLGKQLLIEDLDASQCYVWRTLYKRTFLLDNQIFFYPGIVYEDVPFTHECYLKAQKCIITQSPIYIYRQRRTESITSFINEKKAKQLCIAIAQTWKLTLLENISMEEHKKLEDDIYQSFIFLIRSIVHANTLKSESKRTMIIDYLKCNVPYLYFSNRITQKTISWLYQHTPHMLIHILYYYIIIVEDRILPTFYHSNLYKYFHT